jgi:rhodanese-related sulfurtransferase
MKHFLTVSILFFVLLLSGCGEAETSSVGSNAEDSVEASATTGITAESPGERVSVSSGSFTRLSPGELRNMKEKENFPLVNVYVPFAGDIPGTDLSIPYNEIEENLDKLPPDKAAKIVLYCLGGPMSFDAAETLVKLGYTNISDLDGGMEAWQNAGFDLKGA